jgi:N-acyl-D-aspartate/D-glutamate deacylase
VLEHNVRNEAVLTLEEAMRKMTSFPAQRFGLILVACSERSCRNCCQPKKTRSQKGLRKRADVTVPMVNTALSLP